MLPSTMDLQRAACELPAGFRQPPVLHAFAQLMARCDALLAALTSFDSPPAPAGQFLHIHKHPTLGAMDCHLEWEEGDPEAGWAERIALCAAYLRGVDIADRLTTREVEAIEREAAQQPKQFLEPA